MFGQSFPGVRVTFYPLPYVVDSFMVAWVTLRVILVQLQVAHLKLKLTKCELFHETIEYLGH